MLQSTLNVYRDDLQTLAHESAMALNRTAHANTAKLTAGLSPVALTLAYGDWLLNLMSSPGTHAWLLTTAQQRALEAVSSTLYDQPLDGAPNERIEPTGAHAASDERFASTEWQQWPYRGIARGFMAWDRWCRDATRLPGMAPHHVDMVGFYTGQILDMLAPSNSPLSPAVARTMVASGGQNLLQGTRHLIEDWRRLHDTSAAAAEPIEYLPGRDVAITPGKVVYRNDLIELIQYTPTTEEVYAEPVLIIPSWIMKFYILDLSPHNSMVRYLVSQGHTVFIVSWRNPDASDSLLSMDDYLKLGVLDALAAIKQRIPDTDVHAAGYCLGGTLLAIAAAALSRPGSVQDGEQLPALKSVSLLAAQVDFNEPGEMGVLIDPVQIRWLEDLMVEKGYLSGRQMAGSFQFLHARELVWSRGVREYLLGEREHPNDLMAWNADVTRMPATMHSEYLNSLFLRNDLAEGRYMVEGRAVSLLDLNMPLFAVGTEKDHVSPWPSVFKLHRLTEVELTFVLTSGGHNAGILSEPGHAHRSYRVRTSPAGSSRLPPQEWRSEATGHEGSWWMAWHEWLARRSSASLPANAPGRQPDKRTALCDAPGTYVFVRYDD
jgi:polyhydroxyalkanoate synthase